MSFWRSETIIERLSMLISPGDVSRVKQGAYELSLGPEIYITGEPRKRQLHPDEQIFVPPGQMALLLTEESVSIPPEAIGFISMKSSKKLSGLVNISGFHVDPGFQGRLVFSVYNAGPDPVYLTRGAAVFMIWYSSLDGPTTDLYRGSHNGQASITDAMVQQLQGHMSSPAALQEQINALRDDISRVKYIWGAGWGIALFILGIVATKVADKLLGP